MVDLVATKLRNIQKTYNLGKFKQSNQRESSFILNYFLYFFNRMLKDLIQIIISNINKNIIYTKIKVWYNFSSYKWRLVFNE